MRSLRPIILLAALVACADIGRRIWPIMWVRSSSEESQRMVPAKTETPKRIGAEEATAIAMARMQAGDSTYLWKPTKNGATFRNDQLWHVALEARPKLDETRRNQPGPRQRRAVASVQFTEVAVRPDGAVADRFSVVRGW